MSTLNFQMSFKLQNLMNVSTGTDAKGEEGYEAAG